MAERTLSEVVDELMSVREAAEDTTSAVQQNEHAIEDLTGATIKFFKMFDQKFDQDRLDRAEERKERPVGVPANNNSSPSNMKVDEDQKSNFLMTVLRGTFLGTLAARITGALRPVVTAITANLLTPLTYLGKLLLRNGPVAAVIGLLYATFKDIGDNPEFQAAVRGIADVWNNEVVPTWANLKEAFVNFLNTEGMQTTMAGIGAIWSGATAWFTDFFKPAMQNILVDQIEIFTDRLSAVMDSINMWIDGDKWGAVTNFVNSIGTALIESFDSLATNVLSMVGITFGDDGTLLTFVQGSIDRMTQYVMDGWNGLANFVMVTIPQWWNGIQTSIGDTISSIGDSIRDRIAAGAQFLGGVFDRIQLFFTSAGAEFDNTIDGLRIGFAQISNFIQNIPDRLLRLIGGILDFEIPRLAIPYDNFLGKGEIVLFPGGRPFSSVGDIGQAANTRIATRNSEMDQSIQRLEATMASRLEELAAMRAELDADRGGSNITVVAPSSTSNVQNSSTSISTFPSPFDNYRPQ